MCVLNLSIYFFDPPSCWYQSCIYKSLLHSRLVSQSWVWHCLIITGVHFTGCVWDLVIGVLHSHASIPKITIFSWFKMMFVELCKFDMCVLNWPKSILVKDNKHKKTIGQPRSYHHGISTLTHAWPRSLNPSPLWNFCEVWHLLRNKCRNSVKTFEICFQPHFWPPSFPYTFC
jgi:hypothetical protein